MRESWRRNSFLIKKISQKSDVVFISWWQRWKRKASAHLSAVFHGKQRRRWSWMNVCKKNIVWSAGLCCHPDQRHSSYNGHSRTDPASCERGLDIDEAIDVVSVHARIRIVIRFWQRLKMADRIFKKVVPRSFRSLRYLMIKFAKIQRWINSHHRQKRCLFIWRISTFITDSALTWVAASYTDILNTGTESFL